MTKTSLSDTPSERLFILLAVLILLWYTNLMHYDYKTLYEKNAAFYEHRPKAKKALIYLNITLPALYFAAYAALLVYAALTDFPVREFIGVLFVPAVCLLCVMLLRLLIDRPRPYSENGANITPILQKKSKDKESFPSRHLASAVVIAITILPYLAWAGICLLVFSLALGYIRFALGLHYPSDLFGGALLGAICSLLYLL